VLVSGGPGLAKRQRRLGKKKGNWGLNREGRWRRDQGRGRATSGWGRLWGGCSWRESEGNGVWRLVWPGEMEEEGGGKMRVKVAARREQWGALWLLGTKKGE
jgi:hypothetical protein